MKKIFVSLALIALICLSPGLSFGAESEYVRKDVFEAYMQSINTKFDRILSEISGIKTEMANMKRDNANLRTEVKSEIANLRGELKAEIANLRSELKAEIAEIKTELKTQRNDITSLTQTVATLAEQVRGLNNSLAQHIRESENRITDIRNDIYLGLVVLGVIFSIPNIKEFFNNREVKKAKSQTITLEDVKRLIDEAKLGSKSSA